MVRAVTRYREAGAFRRRLDALEIPDNTPAAQLAVSLSLSYTGSMLNRRFRPSFTDFARLIVATILSVILPLQAAATPDTRELQSSLLEAVDRADIPTFKSLLAQLKRQDAAAVENNNYDYALARMLESSGERAAAAALYQQIADRHSTLAQYALWRLSRYARDTGNPVLERNYLRQIEAAFPNGLLSAAATDRLSSSLLESRDFEGAIAYLGSPRFGSGGQLSRPRGLLLAVALSGAGRTEDARRRFHDLISNGESDDVALEAVTNLDRIDQQNPLDLSEHLLRARVLHFNRVFEPARSHYKAVIGLEMPAEDRAAVLYQIGRTYYQESQFPAAVEFFDRSINASSRAQSLRDSLAFKAAALARMKQYDTAIETYKALISAPGDDPTPERAYLNIIDTLRDAGKFSDALEWAEKTRSQFKGQTAEALALFARAKIFISTDSWDKAIATLGELRGFSDLGGVKTPGGTDISEVTYLLGYSQEKAGRFEDAVLSYLQIPDGINKYYGALASKRLLALASDPTQKPLISRQVESLLSARRLAQSKADFEGERQALQGLIRLTSEPAERGVLLDQLRNVYGRLPRFSKLRTPRTVALSRTEYLMKANAGQQGDSGHARIADDLLFLRLYDEGVPELIAARKAQSKSFANGSVQSTDAILSDELFSLASYAVRGGRADQTVSIVEGSFKTLPSDFQVELIPKEELALLFPAPFIDSVNRHAKPRSVDPRFLLSLARQETRFRPDAKSNAAARGLLQFIPSTADRIAGELGMSGFTQERLYDPDTALLFGSQYVSNLFKLFPEMPEAVAASYNGGEDNVARWVARSRSKEPGRYVSEIGFTQSKDYVFKVMSNYWTYSSLYNADLSRR